MRGANSSFANSVFSLAPSVTKTFLQPDTKQNIAVSKRFSMMYQSSGKITGRQFDDARSSRSKHLTKFEKAQQRHLRQITQSEAELKKISAN